MLIRPAVCSPQLQGGAARAACGGAAMHVLAHMWHWRRAIPHKHLHVGQPAGKECCFFCVVVKRVKHATLQIMFGAHDIHIAPKRPRLDDSTSTDTLLLRMLQCRPFVLLMHLVLEGVRTCDT